MKLLVAEKSKTKKTQSPQEKKKRIIYWSVLGVGAVLIIAAMAIFVFRADEETSARSEYESVRDAFFYIANPAYHDTSGGMPNESEPIADSEDAPGGDLGDIIDEAQQRRLAMANLLEINSDFIGWISIEGLIEYPVVRGSDNSKYLNTTFKGQRNSAGTIFMDYRHSLGFDESICILYGHLTRDGTMFSELHRFRDSEFLQENPYIKVTTLDGELLTYRVFAAKITDVWNSAYTLSITNTTRAIADFPNTPRDASRFLLLSTCTPGLNDDERLLVFAALA